MPCTALSEKDPEDKQKVKSDGTDLAAYDYEGGTPTGAEIESAGEAQATPSTSCTTWQSGQRQALPSAIWSKSPRTREQGTARQGAEKTHVRDCHPILSFSIRLDSPESGLRLDRASARSFM